MRNHENMPILDWGEEKAPHKAQAQILLQEPVILQMPTDFNAAIDGDRFGCKLDEDSGILYDCDGGELLHHLAQANRLPGLKTVADACSESSSQVDIDNRRKRIIVHD